MASSNSAPLLFRKDVVALSLKTVRSAPIHAQFSAYLALRLAAAESGASNGFSSSDIRGFFDRFLRVAGLPPDKPYIRPFDKAPPSDSNLLMNANVPGSFAGSSLRDVAPLRKVIEISGKSTNTRYALSDNHWDYALEHLCFGKRVPALPLAIFLFRDYGFRPRKDGISLGLALEAFLDIFGYLNDAGKPSEEFETLFEIAGPDFREFPFENPSSF